MNNTILKNNIIQHFECYPKAKIQDYLKFIYQEEFGCGHLLADVGASFERLKEEAMVANMSQPTVEILGENFARLHLSALKELSMETFHRLFVLSARQLTGSEQGFYAKAELLKEVCLSENLPFTVEEIELELAELKKKTLKPFSHSLSFHQEYQPAYRVIEQKYVQFLPLIAKIDEMLTQNPQTVLSIDGDCGSGKTTLAELLREIYDCNLISMDDFFLQKEQRTPERLAEIGGNIDYERFCDEVLIPLKAGVSFSYQPFNCQTFAFDDPVHLQTKNLTIIEGSYSQHPIFAKNYDWKVFLSVPENIQSTRILKRNGAFLHEKFQNIWIPMEKKFFSTYQIKENSDMQFEILTSSEQNNHVKTEQFTS